MNLQHYMDLLVKLWPLHRTLVSDDTDTAYEYIHSFLKDALRLPSRDILVHEFPSGAELSTWIVPKKYTLKDYGLTQLGANERSLVDRSNISLSIAEYSQPIDAVMEWEDLKSHLFHSDRRPDAIPFVFKYFYRSNYGFCLPRRSTTPSTRARSFKHGLTVSSARER